MIFIVPAKTGSTRVPDKNWREFSGGKSLVEICVEKLLRLGTVYVSCDDESKGSLVESWGCKFHLRPQEWARNDFPLTDWIRETTAYVRSQHGSVVEGVYSAYSGDIGWAQVTSPLFNEYEEMLREWELNTDQNDYDSMVAVYQNKGYYLDSSFRPVHWGWGPWHTVGQDLPRMYQMPWVFSILSQDSIRETGYHIGKSPKWYVTDGRVDIDTWDDWEYAKYLYEKNNKLAEIT